MGALPVVRQLRGPSWLVNAKTIRSRSRVAGRAAPYRAAIRRIDQTGRQRQGQGHEPQRQSSDGQQFFLSRSIRMAIVRPRQHVRLDSRRIELLQQADTVLAKLFQEIVAGDT